MTKLIAIVGMGEGVAMAIAQRFGREGFAIAMLARSEAKLQGYQTQLQAAGITAHYFLADAGSASEVKGAIADLQAQLGTPTVLIYNAAVPRQQSPIDTSVEDLVGDFQVNVAGALVATQAVLPGMEQAADPGTIIFTGGGFALYPSPDFASLSVGKAGLRSLAHTLAAALADRGVRVGMVTIAGTVDPAAAKHNPTAIAEQYWQFYTDPQAAIEIVY
ncbi:MAG TPA: SDR family NAD(P)-dependent oxidoreductase [Candidatus Obscuribacterales bacterium]